MSGGYSRTGRTRRNYLDDDGHKDWRRFTDAMDSFSKMLDLKKEGFDFRRRLKDPDTVGGTWLHFIAIRSDALGKKGTSWVTSYRDCYRIFRLIMDEGIDINDRDDDGRTPLFIAACSNDPVVVRVILDLGGAPDMPDCEGTYPILNIAASRAFRPIVNRALQKVPHLEMLIGPGGTLAHYLVDRLDALKVLLTYDIDLEVRSSLNFTVLAKAALWSNYPPRGSFEAKEAVRMLLEAGADPDAVVGIEPRGRLRDLAGYNATGRVHPEVVEFFQQMV